METLKVKHDNPFGYMIINAEDLTPDMEIYGEVVEVKSIGEGVQVEGSDLPPVATPKKKRTTAKG